MMSMMDLCFDVSEDELGDVIDITDEDTLLYFPSPSSSPRQNNHNDVIVIDDNTVLNSPTMQQETSLKSTLTVNMPSPLTIDEELDVIEVTRHTDVIVIDEELFENNGDVNDVVTENVEKANALYSQLQSQESHPNKEQKGTAVKNCFKSPPWEASPTTSSYSRDIKDTNALHLESKEIALSFYSQQVLASEPAAMVMIPTPLKKEEDNLENVNDSLKELLKNKVELKPLPTYSTWSASLIPDNTYSEKSSLRSTIDASQKIDSMSAISTDHNPSTTKLLSTYHIEENPLEGPSSLLDDNTRSTLDLSSMDLSQTTSFTSISPANMKIVRLKEQMSSINKTSTTTLPHKEVLHKQSPISALSVENTTLTLPSSLSQLSATKASIFESPEVYQLCYKKYSLETRSILDRLSLHHENAKRIFDKYFNKNATNLKNDPINVGNNDHVDVNYQNSKINENNTDKLEEPSSNDLPQTQKKSVNKKNSQIDEELTKIKENLSKFGTEINQSKVLNHDKSQNKHVKNVEYKTSGEELNCFSDLELKNVCKTAIEKNIQSEVPHQPDVSIISIRNITSKESQSEKIETKAKKTENNDPSDVIITKCKRKQCSSMESENQKVFDNINITHDFPKSKKPKNHDCSLAKNEDNQQKLSIVSSKSCIKSVAEMNFKGPKSSSKINEDKSKNKKEFVQKLTKCDKKFKLIKTYETDTSVPNQNEYHKLSTFDLLPRPSKQPVEKVNKKTSSKRLSETVESVRNVSNKPIYNLVPQQNNSNPHLEITVNLPCPVHCTCVIHSRREVNPTLNTHNYMPCQAGFQYCSSVNAPNNISYPKKHQKFTLNHKFQPQLVNELNANYLKTATELPHFKMPNYPVKVLAPKYDPCLLSNANNGHNNKMMNIPMAQLRGQGTPYFNNILEVPTTSTRDPNTSYMTVNGAPPIAHSQADSITRLKSDEMRPKNDCLVGFNYYMPPRLPTPPHYKHF